MPKSVTRGSIDRVAIVFDFDRTLADGTIDAILRHVGIDDADRWYAERIKPMIEDGWDEILARAYALARTGEERGKPITKRLVEEVGGTLKAYPGLDEALDRLCELGREASGGGTVELYVLSSGFVDIIVASPVAEHFNDIWGSALHFDEKGGLAGVKRTVTHSEKARYLRALAKGLSVAGANEPQDVEKPKPVEEWHVPLDQMIYVGDGASDIAAFNLMHDHGGIALAVNQSQRTGEWDAREHIFDDARVENLAAPDYREGAEMRRSLELAVEIVAKRVALRRLAKGE